MSAIENREKFQVICHGKTTNYWCTDDENEANLIFEMMLQYIRKQYYKIQLCEFQLGNYITKNEVCTLGRMK